MTSLTSYDDTTDIISKMTSRLDDDDDVTSIGVTDHELGEFYFDGRHQSDKNQEKTKKVIFECIEMKSLKILNFTNLRKQFNKIQKI